MKSLKEYIEDCDRYLSTLSIRKFNALTLAIEKRQGIIRTNHPIYKNIKVSLNGVLINHTFRANIIEGWVEQYVPIEIDSVHETYEVKNGYPVIVRKYGQVEVYENDESDKG